MAQLNNLIVTGDARINGDLIHNSGMVAFGTNATAAATAAKVVTIADPAWALKVGNIIGVKHSISNTAESCTLNVNGTGAKSIYYNTSVYTGTSTMICGAANRTTFYIYDGTYWVWLGGGYDANDNIVPAAVSWTAAATAAKTATQDYYTAIKGYTLVTFQYANSAASAITLNINGKGAKPIYLNGTASSASNYTLPAGCYLTYFNGTNYYIRTDGKITGSITGDAATVNGLTVQTAVPANAKFTDTNTTYTFATGDSNGQIKVTPSGGSTQNVSVKGLAAAAYKGVDTSVASGSTSTNVPTSKAVADLVATISTQSSAMGTTNTSITCTLPDSL